ncbi:hypothetical protein KSP39_PZI013882 [Platanthera zijinensis]|uniref:Peptidase S54 rhomboid domain-containing protein n=1 Tax=Platanthera zijinensis TaxID=2320716 RepID=A0AAP0BDY4_9ASPA
MIYTSMLFYGPIPHIVFNMLALIPLGIELERIMGSIRLLYLMILLATSNVIFHLIFAFIVALNSLHPYPFLVHECAIGFSGVIFSMIVIETSLSGVQTKSVSGLFNMPAKWYAWILLVLFQLLATNVSLLGHLCGGSLVWGNPTWSKDIDFPLSYVVWHCSDPERGSAPGRPAAQAPI